MSDDRTVHAERGADEIVRYDRAGAWYLERHHERVREHIGVREAARMALHFEAHGGTIHLGLPGGATFDRLVRKVSA